MHLLQTYFSRTGHISLKSYSSNFDFLSVLGHLRKLLNQSYSPKVTNFISLPILAPFCREATPLNVAMKLRIIIFSISKSKNLIEWRIYWSIVSPLWKDKGFMGAAFCTFWDVLGSFLVSYRDTIGVSWFFCEQKKQEGLEYKPSMLVLDGLEVRNRFSFNDEVFSFRRLKSDFVCFLWSKTKLFINDCPLTLVNLFDCLGTCWGSNSFGIFLLFKPWWWKDVYFLYTLGHSFGSSF